MGKLIKSEKPQILLIQETKMKGTKELREMKQIWKESDGVALNSRGSLGGIHTIWYTPIFKEEHRLESPH
jgi:hypothetical protein